jgi:hypothetical protein
LNDGDTGYGGLTIFDCVQGNVNWQGQSYINNYYNPNASQQDILACHEIGHMLGLQHQDVSGSCMRSDQFPSSEQPDSHDIEVVNSKY